MKHFVRNLFAAVVLVFSVAIMSNMGPAQAAGTVKSVTIKSPTSSSSYKTDLLYKSTGTVKASISVSGSVSKSVYYKSSDPSIVTVGKTTGSMVYKKDGTATITAYAKANPSKKDTIKVRVYDRGVQKVAITKPTTGSTYTMLRYSTADSTKQLSQSVTRKSGVSGAVTYSSSKSSVVSVDSKGVMTAKTPGTAVITVKSKLNSSMRDTLTVTVVQRISKLQIGVDGSFAKDDTPTYYTYPGMSMTTKVTYVPSNATTKKVTYNSSKPEVATINSSGVITAKALGTTTITVTAADGSKKTETFNVTVKKKSAVKVSSISITGTPSYLNAGDTKKLTADVKPSNASNKTLAWSSSKPSTLKVDTAGKITAVAPGKATITARATDGSGKSAVTTEINVYAPTTKLTLDKTSLALSETNTYQLKATLAPANTDDTYTFISDNLAVASVSSTGLVKAEAPGEATITCAVTDKRTGQITKTATCTVKVDYLYKDVSFNVNVPNLVTAVNKGVINPNFLGNMTYESGEDLFVQIQNVVAEIGKFQVDGVYFPYDVTFTAENQATGVKNVYCASVDASNQFTMTKNNVLMTSEQFKADFDQAGQQKVLLTYEGRTDETQMAAWINNLPAVIGKMTNLGIDITASGTMGTFSGSIGNIRVENGQICLDGTMTGSATVYPITISLANDESGAARFTVNYPLALQANVAALFSRWANFMENIEPAFSPNVATMSDIEETFAPEVSAEAQKATEEELKAEETPEVVETPETEVEAPKADVEAPKTDVEAPETDVEAPETDVEAPETDVEAPETDEKVQDVKEEPAEAAQTLDITEEAE
ncbi:Ig-like domain-containing protein [Hespellia stercorisuis]|uniref:Ig-like domain (Group 2) n=1 Tax=Hespellia stercorisuis DSM 15480 TaxID=1121950 RepID=A0A1M6S8D5_9FIRM|nr:Ig-like domain-containing protein [Hespellia stercorisuis]SHK41064.1 Ig-like domain (group 2) [Hespellia stercorisuis DSM 15480]